MSYREKECPTCGTKHRKRGPYCSRSCGNHRKWTEEQKQVFREKKLEYMHTTDEGEVERWRINAKEETMPIQPLQDETGLENNQFVEDGDIWTTDEGW
jgi:endogenous inhibitor of DNA gyrase (YacG/DUF329 family)